MRHSTAISIPADFKNAHSARRNRIGKSAKDASSGARSRNDSNKQARVTWQQETRATGASFPAHTCNGNGNSSNRRPDRRPAKAH